jgi:hypothetical protein
LTKWVFDTKTQPTKNPKTQTMTTLLLIKYANGTVYYHTLCLPTCYLRQYVK